MDIHDGTPRAHQLERVRDVDALREVLHVFPIERVELHEFPDGGHDLIRQRSHEITARRVLLSPSGLGRWYCLIVFIDPRFSRPVFYS